MRRSCRFLGAAALALVALASGGCGGSQKAPPLVVGAVDDAAKWAPDPGRAMDAAKSSGFDVIVLSAVWSHNTTADHDLPPLRRAVRAAVAHDVKPVLAVYQLSSSTPTTDGDRAAFAAYAAALAHALPAVREVIVGNEPNLNLFWAPQFGADGSDSAAGSYEALLATTYDALKSLDSPPEVIGGGLAPRGGDDPGASRQTSTETSSTADLLRQLAETATALSRRVEELENPLASASEPTKITRPPRTASAVTTGRALSTVYMRPLVRTRSAEPCAPSRIGASMANAK